MNLEQLETRKNILLQELSEIDAEIQRIKVVEKNAQILAEKEQRARDYKLYQEGFKAIYNVYIEELKKYFPRYGFKSGKKWDTFFYDNYHKNVQRFKVEKSTGEVYHMGKHSKGNIIRDLFFQIKW